MKPVVALNKTEGAKTIRKFFITAACVIGLTGLVAASNAAIINPSFETGDLSDWQNKGGNEGVISGTTPSPDDGDYTAFNDARSKETVAFAETDGSAIWQSAGTVVGTRDVTLTIALAKRDNGNDWSDTPVPDPYKIGLYTDTDTDNEPDNILAEVKNPIGDPQTDSVSTTFQDASVTASNVADGTELFVGTFMAHGDPGEQLLIDNVRTTTLIPEPTSLALLALGMLTFLARRPRRK